MTNERETILVCDDSAVVRELIDRQLTSESRDVVHAPTAERCLEIARDRRIDLVLLDLAMPGMDGFETFRRLRALESSRHVPVVFLTDSNDPDTLATALDMGAADYVTKPFAAAELIARVRRALRTKNRIDHLVRHVRIDPLTGIGNRRAFDEAVSLSISDHRRSGRPFCLLLVDVDEFKAINDRYGHSAGDAVLRGVAAVIRGSCRPNDAACRFGGDEFALVLHDTGFEDAFVACRRIEAALTSAELCYDGETIRFSCSLGLASSEPLTADFDSESIVRCADQALYTAKRDGRSRLCIAPDRRERA